MHQRHPDDHPTQPPRRARAWLATCIVGVWWLVMPHDTAATPQPPTSRPGTLRGASRAPIPQLAPVFGSATIKATPAPTTQKATPAPPSFAPATMKQPALRRRRLSGKGRQLARRYRRYHRQLRRYRALIETDKPLYRPGETVWIRVVEVGVQGERLPQVEQRAYIRLLNARRQVVGARLVKVQKGHSAAAFTVGPRRSGGVYTIQYANIMSGTRGHHQVQLQAYMAQRLRKTLRFLRRGLGPGDLVLASLKLLPASGQPKPRPFTVSLRLGGKQLRQWRQTTDAKGMAVISFRLPPSLPTNAAGRPDGQLVIKLQQAGVTESLLRDLPLASDDIDVGFFAEGGDAIVGLPSRIYFAAKDKRSHRPVDLTGTIKDDKGHTIATIKSVHRGMGRFVYTPKPGRRYALHITQPAGIKRTYPLPHARRDGVAMQLLDDLLSRRKALHLRLQSKRSRRIFGLVTQGHQVIGQGTWQLQPGAHKIVIPLTHQRRGVARITLFGANGVPLGERLTFRHLQRGLTLSITPKTPPKGKGYQPRQTATFVITANDPAGRPVAGAHLGVAVVDDALLRQADDHTPGWLAQRYLRGPELTGSIFRPNFYFSSAPTAPQGLDLVMGTHGWRRFREAPRQWRRFRRPPRVEKPFDAVKRTSAWRAEIKRTKRLPKPEIPKPKASDWERWFPPPKRLQAGPKGSKRRRLPQMRRDRLGGDRDGDGIPDVMDKCPSLPGPRSRQGCPTRRPRLIKINRSRLQIMTRVYFSAGSYRIKRHSYPLLNEVANVLKQYPMLQLRIEGNTDNRERPRGAMLLSRQRARQVRRYLIKKGIHPWRLVVKGYGATRPITRNTTPLNRAKNRSVHFSIISQRWRRPQGPWWLHVAAIRAFPTKFYKGPRGPKARRDNRSTLMWAPHLTTDKQGRATVSFGLSDRITTYRLRVSGVGGGLLGTSKRFLSVHQPLYLQVRWPNALSYGDGLALPVTVHNTTMTAQRISLQVKTSQHLALAGSAPQPLALKPGQRVTWFVPLRVKARYGAARIDLTLQTADGQRRDHHSRTLPIKTMDFPHRTIVAGLLRSKGKRTYKTSLVVPNDQRGIALKGAIKLHPSLLGRLRASADKMLREPRGCFEQTSASNFPNTMLLQLLHGSYQVPPQLLKRTYGMVRRGATRLQRFRTSSGGYSLYGRGHGSLWLTAYGIWQFAEMKRVVPFPQAVIDDAARWLRSQRKPTGGYTNRSYWRGISSALAIEAYIAFALAEAGFKRLDWELRHLLPNLTKQGDPYVIALALNAMVRAWGKGDKRVKPWVRRLRAMQQKTGAFLGTSRAVVGSYGHDLHVQTTALALLALSRAGVAWDQLVGGLYWLQQQSHRGTFGSTQATILALKALLAYQRSRAKAPPTGARVVVTVNGAAAETATIAKDAWQTIALTRWRHKLRTGRNVVQLKLQGQQELPYELQLSYMASQPNATTTSPLKLTLSLSTQKARQGQVVRLHVTVTNKSPKVQWFPLLRLQLPGGLRSSVRQLKAMQTRGTIDLFETNKRAIYLYLRKLKPRQSLRLSIDCVAEVTGHFVGNTSHAYPYYNPRQSAWAAPLRIAIGR